MSRSADLLSKSQLTEKPEHFEQVFELYYRPVSYYFARRGCSEEDCRDLTQETFLGFYKGLAGYRTDASLKTWLFTIAANIWRNWLRGRATQKRNACEIPLGTPSEEDQEVAVNTSNDDDPLAGLLADELKHLVRQELEELPPRMRDCLLLRLDQELKYSEIAEIMGVSVEKVKSLLHQARTRLQTRLGAYIHDA